VFFLVEQAEKRRIGNMKPRNGSSFLFIKSLNPLKRIFQFKSSKNIIFPKTFFLEHRFGHFIKTQKETFYCILTHKNSQNCPLMIRSVVKK